MKKLVTLTMILILLVSMNSAQAQRRLRYRNSLSSEITRMERMQLQRDAARYMIARRAAERDGFVGPLEKRKLHKMKARTRCDAYRFRHNSRHRVI